MKRIVLSIRDYTIIYLGSSNHSPPMSGTIHLRIFNANVCLLSQQAWKLFKSPGLWDKFDLDCISGKGDQQLLKFEVKLFARCSLRFARCSLLFTRCSLLFACCSLLFARCPLFFARCSLLVTFCSLLVAFCSLLVTFYSLLNKKFWRICFE